MTPNPIRRVLSILSNHNVRFLLMGGQACVFYGAAEFSRDTDILLFLDSENIERLNGALRELQAKVIAVPPFSDDYLRRGHAVHFRCHQPDVSGMRIDILSYLREGAPFDALWERRTTIDSHDGQLYELLSLPDLVRAKKTQRDKDWPMIRRLVEAHFAQNRENPDEEQVRFWFRECRTPSLLLELAPEHPAVIQDVSDHRALLAHAAAGESGELEIALAEEERLEREADREYWRPLRKELEQLRHQRRR